MTEGTLIKAPTKAMQSLIGKANEEHALAMNGTKATLAAKSYALKHALACGKLLLEAKSKAPHGTWEGLFEGGNVRSEGDKNLTFGLTRKQATLYQKLARYPRQARAAMIEDDGERFNLDRTYAALSDASVDGEEEAKRKTLALKHTGDEESYTPAQYIESARAVMGSIDTDPASNDRAQETVQAGVYYTVDDDGLDKDWRGNLWMNPPYTARVINEFIDKAVAHYVAGNLTAAIILTNNNTDTSWFHIGANIASAVCFTAGRINFLKPDGTKSSPTNGQLFLYFGQDVEGFKREFSQHGMVMVKA